MRRRIVEEARVGPGERVVEVGPGRGALTEGLVRGIEEGEGHLYLVELDDALAGALLERYRDHPRVTVLHRSILDLPLEELEPEADTLKVVGNIPYNLTSPILFHLLRRPRPREIVLMVQREVADRILSPPGTRAYGALSVGVRSIAKVERVLRLAPGSFRPRPKVESEVLRIRPIHPAPLTPSEEEGVRVLTRALFQWRRKQLGKILRDHPDLALAPAEVARLLAAAGAEPMDRPERLSPDGFLEMARALPPTLRSG